MTSVARHSSGSAERKRDESRSNEHEARLREGFIRSIVSRGYSATTIADIVREARVSKRTFYEHFDDKEACFLAVYAHESRRVLEAMRTAAEESIAAGRPFRAHVEAALRAYIETLASNPELARTCLLEIHAAGGPGLALRRTILEEFADALRAFVDLARLERPELRPLGPSMAMAIVGGINELLLLNVERGRSLRATDLAKTGYDLVEAVLAPPR